MRIKFSPYKKKDGTLMLYINRSNGVSVGITAEEGWAPYGKRTTAGMRNVYNAAVDIIDASTDLYRGDISTHKETGFCAPIVLGNNWVLVGTDVASIGGQDVGEDGHYVIAHGKIIRCGVWLDEVNTPIEGE